MRRKGFPESYNLPALVQFVSDVKAGRPGLQIPVYSHRHYDIVPHACQVIDQPDIMIIEGLNVLQIGTDAFGHRPRVFISVFFDFSIYVHADTEIIRQWYIERFLTFRKVRSTIRNRFLPALPLLQSVKHGSMPTGCGQ